MALSRPQHPLIKPDLSLPPAQEGMTTGNTRPGSVQVQGSSECRGLREQGSKGLKNQQWAPRAALARIPLRERRDLRCQ